MDSGRTLRRKSRFCIQTEGLPGEPSAGAFIPDGEPLTNLTGPQKPVRKISWHKSDQRGTEKR